MNIKALLFDLDGTILDSVPVILAASRETCEQMGIGFDEEFARSLIGIPLEPQGELFAPGQGDEFVERYRQVYGNYHSLDTRLFPGAAEALQALKDCGLRMAIVTSKSLMSTSRIVQAAGINGYFDTIVTADHVTRHKPDPEPILKALEVLGVTAQEAVYIGDAKFDVQAASRAGVPMIGVSWGAGTREDLVPGCVRMMDSWSELLDWACALPPNGGV